ncbi:N-acetyltransferase GCN5 [Globomyces pollinis-pini]|nr:N-acetyltransferase GCN5 [Globomyces pollinis-pini]KAJ2996887.1 hypothetical protein HDV02_006062 [Globomyces sp. JEL0801]
MTAMKVREATIEDLPLILTFIQELAEFEKLSDACTANIEGLSKNLFPKNGNPYANVIIGMIDDIPIGMALYFFNFSTFTGAPGLYLEDLYIREQYRGHGAGKQFFTELKKIALAKECKRMEWVVLDWNEKARKFYKNIYAKEQSDWIICRLDGEDLSRPII